MVKNDGNVNVRNLTDVEKIYARGDLYRNEEEGFYLIAGVVTVYTESGASEATPGSFVLLPRGSKHWFRNNGNSNAKMLVLVAPGGMEGLFRLTGRPADDAKSPIRPSDDDEKQRLLSIAPQFGI